MNQIIPDRIGVADAKPKVIGDRLQGTGKSATGDDPFGDQCEPSAGIWLQPLHDRVLVQRNAAQKFTASGIVISDQAQEKALRGRVIAVGPGKRDEHGVFHETMVKPGDLVLFSASVNVPYPDLVEYGDLVMMSEADILGILRSS